MVGCDERFALKKVTKLSSLIADTMKQIENEKDVKRTCFRLELELTILHYSPLGSCRYRYLHCLPIIM